jgi:hypothetical protein
MRLRETLLKVVNPGAAALPCPAGDQALAFAFGLSRLCTPTRPALLAFHRSRDCHELPAPSGPAKRLPLRALRNIRRFTASPSGLAASSRRDGPERPSGSNLHQLATVRDALRQGELLRPVCAPVRPLNPRHVRHTHRGELWMQLAYRLRRPLRRALALPAAGAGDAPATLGSATIIQPLWRSFASDRSDDWMVNTVREEEC